MVADDETSQARSGHAHARLENGLAYRFAVLTRALQGCTERGCLKRYGISHWQWRVLAVLGEGKALRATDIVRRVSMDKVAVSRALSRLESLRWVWRGEDPEDNRTKLIHLTDAGRATHQRIVAGVRKQEEMIRHELGADDADNLDQLLNELAAIISPEEPLWRASV